MADRIDVAEALKGLPLWRAHEGDRPAIARSLVGNPKVVMLDEPQATAESMGFRYAGWNVAPVVSKTISRIAPMLGVRPDRKRDANMAEVLPYIREKG